MSKMERITAPTLRGGGGVVGSKMQMTVTFFLSPSLPLLPAQLGCAVLQKAQQSAHSQTTPRPPSCKRSSRALSD